MNRQSPSRLDSVLIPLLICLCLAILSIGVTKHVRESEQPPLYDAITYVAKAKAFWDMVASGHWTNPLDLQPASRPPGTILLSYPFGFSKDYKGFLARSILLPVFLFVAALYVAAFRSRMSPSEHFDLAAVALILASLPCFYHFEAADGINSPTYWGLVDSFLAAVAALAFATGYRAVQSGSRLMLAFASLLTGLCLTIKPAGVIVAMVIITVLVIIKIISDINRPGGRLLSLQLLWFVIAVSAGTGLLLLAALKSQYLSRETFQWGNQATTILRTEFRFALSLENLNTVLHPAFGLNVIVLGVAATIAAIRICVGGLRTRDLRNTWIALPNLVLSMFVLTVGTFFWLVYADLSQVRYYYPFAFVSLVLVATFLLGAIRAKRAPLTRSLLYGSAAILFGGLTTMLYLRHVDTPLQQMYGVNLTSIKHRDERLLADLLLQYARIAKHNLKVYAMDLGWDFGAIASDGIAATVLKSDEPSFAVSFPVDWRRASAVHLKDLVASDYVLFHPIADNGKRQSLLIGRDTGNLSAELATIAAWLTEANEGSGLKQLATGTRTLKQVVDRDLFARSIAKWAATVSWREVFTRENSDFLKNVENSNKPSNRWPVIPGSADCAERQDQSAGAEKARLDSESPWSTQGSLLRHPRAYFGWYIDPGTVVLAQAN
jgi:hypothetical protein